MLGPLAAWSFVSELAMVLSIELAPPSLSKRGDVIDEIRVSHVCLHERAGRDGGRFCAQTARPWPLSSSYRYNR